MLRSHDVCPMCDRELSSSKHINEACSELQINYSLSFYHDQCFRVSPSHIVYQIRSLYGDLYFLEIKLPNDGICLRNNYVLNKAKIIYLDKNLFGQDSIDFEGKVLELDFPKLNKIRNKAKNLSLVL